MIDRDRGEFAKMMADVYDYYSKDLSESVLEIWWTAVRPYDLAAVRKALGQHAVNPDRGSYLPKASDVVLMLGGSTLDSALVAWSKLEEALSRVGRYMTVVFDDPLIHRVVDEMGGWTVIGACSARDWPFKQNEFVNRYRGYRMRSETPPYPPRLLGISDGENAAHGYAVDDSNLRFIGDARAAVAVLKGGSTVPRLGFTRAVDAVQLLENKK